MFNVSSLTFVWIPQVDICDHVHCHCCIVFWNIDKSALINARNIYAASNLRPLWRDWLHTFCLYLYLEGLYCALTGINEQHTKHTHGAWRLKSWQSRHHGSQGSLEPFKMSTYPCWIPSSCPLYSPALPPVNISLLLSVYTNFNF